MKLKEYISNLKRGEVKLLAGKVCVSQSFLSQMAAGTCAISPKRCVEIELVTNGKVTRKDLRPNDWHEIWPELQTEVA